MNAATPELAAFIERYVAMWNEPDPVQRRQLIEELWTADCANYTRTMEVRGHDALEARVRASYEKWVRDARCLFRTRNFDIHHGAVRLRWDMADAGGRVISAGLEFLLLAPAGRIREDYQFIEPAA
jgi:hypothetical protein